MSELVQHRCQVRLDEDTTFTLYFTAQSVYETKTGDELLTGLVFCGKPAYDFVEFPDGGETTKVWMCFEHYFRCQPFPKAGATFEGGGLCPN